MDERTERRYHHGDLRRALLSAAAETVAERGPHALSLRELARRVGVSHAAPAHHFGDRTGLLTALAAEGFALMDAELAGPPDAPPAGLWELGRRYVAFALSHPAHFAVMFQTGLLNTEDPHLTAGRTAAFDRLRTAVAGGTADGGEQERAVVAAWSLAHGYASLALAGAAPRDPDRFPDLAQAATRLTP